MDPPVRIHTNSNNVEYDKEILTNDVRSLGYEPLGDINYIAILFVNRAGKNRNQLRYLTSTALEDVEVPVAVIPEP